MGPQFNEFALSMAAAGEFLDLVYGASVEPQLWVPVMERFADMVGGGGGWLSQLSVEDGSGAEMADPRVRADPFWARRYAEHFGQCNPLHNVPNPSEYLKQWAPRVLTDEDWMRKDDLVRSEYYNDFLKPQDIHSAMMIRLARRGEEIATLNISRPERRGQFGKADIARANAVHPHLIRSFALGRKLAETRRVNDDFLNALNLSPHGLFLLDDGARVTHVNRAGEHMMRLPGALSVINGRLCAGGAADARKLQALIAKAASPDAQIRGGSAMALPAPERRLPLSVTVMPLVSERLSFYRGRSVLVCVTDLEAGVSLPDKQLRDVFGLTPAETRLALAVLEGATLREAAERFGISVHTVHVQMSRIFDKTGTHRQTELVRLMMRAFGVPLS
jgi:DNA-binding CsgD family transcriptional regulator